MQIDYPQTPCPECLQSPAKSQHTSDGLYFAVHCDHTKAAGVYHKPSERWRLFCPITENDFTVLVNMLPDVEASIIAKLKKKH